MTGSTAGALRERFRHGSICPSIDHIVVYRGDGVDDAVDLGDVGGAELSVRCSALALLGLELGAGHDATISSRAARSCRSVVRVRTTG